MPSLDFVLPGDLHTLTGGYLYDRHIVEGLETLGWQVRVHGLDGSFPRPTPAALEAAAAVFAALPDGATVVIDGLALGGLAPTLALHRERLRLVALVHHPLALETGLTADERDALFRAERDALAQVGQVIVTSPWTRAALSDYGVAAGRISVVEPGTRAAAPRTGAAHRPHRLLCVASLTPRKGHDVLLEALAGLDADWRLECIGSRTMDPACATRIADRIAGFDLGERVTLAGEIEPAHLPARYAAADTFVLASHMEGYGMVLTEALAAGLPVVSTRAGAIPHVIPEDASLLVPPGDPAALGAALARVVDGGAAWTRLAAAALAARDRLPTWPDTVRRFAAALT
jgi:glycosyltransferase involved in cell wall biosynthesis